MRKVLLYIVYGENQGYYDGAKFSFLTFMNWVDSDSKIEIVILTEKPDEFDNYPVQSILLSKKQKNEWSLNGKYHFRIKNRGLAHIINFLKLDEEDKILFLDTDTYFMKSPLPLFDLIQPNQALFYLNEGLIYKRKRFSIYVDSLEGKVIEIENVNYKLSKKSAMWGSLMIGIMPNMYPSLQWADKLLLKFIDIVPAHTIEPFALSESLLLKYKIVEGKKLVNLYSTSRKKEYAVKILSQFFKNYSSILINNQIILAQKVQLKRSLFTIIKQRFLRLF